MSGVELTYEFSGILDAAMERMDDALDRATGRNAALVQVNTVKGIRNQTRDWPDIQQATKDRKGKSDILVDEGDLSASIEINKRRDGIYDVGTNLEYARVHELGFDAKGIPARPYLQPALEESGQEMQENWRDALEEIFA